jgi:N-methylhydantoinase A
MGVPTLNRDMRAGVDIGGTFTDVVLFDEVSGSLQFGKVPSTPTQLAGGVLDGLTQAGASLPEASTLIHGSTVVINAIIERRGARTALITTQGFRDVYEIGRINRPESFNPRFQKHQPLVPRDLIFEVPERMLVDGKVRTPLDESAAREVARTLRDEKVEAAAVLFIHSYRWPGHELRMAEILREICPGMHVSVSHDLTREYREYERTSTVAANAYVAPIVSTYLDDLERRLAARGFHGSLLIMQSNGGLSDVPVARRQCIQMMESGPAGGVVGTTAIAEALGLESAIAFDMGGTTAKACVVRRGEADIAADYFIGGYNTGLAVRIPVLDIVEVGTGGGSLAWLDEGGGLHVGPRSSGAEPGPVSYGRGGSEPAITDADVLLGRLAPDRFLGGAMPLDCEAAETAMRRLIAEPLGVDVRRAAEGVLEVATASMANAVRQVTLQRGLDPRDFTLVAYGGGGPLHAAAVAAELSIKRILIPQSPGHFSALGMLLADLRRDFVQTVFERLDDVAMAELEAQFGMLEEEGRSALIDSGVPAQAIFFERAVDMRYTGQEHSVGVRLPADVGTEAGRAEIKRRFDDAHERRYSHSAADEAAELVSLRVSAIGRLPKPHLTEIAKGVKEPPSSAHCGGRAVVFAGRELEVPVFDRVSLLAGNEITGPAIVEEDASTTILPPGWRLTVDRFGQLDMLASGDG